MPDSEKESIFADESDSKKTLSGNRDVWKVMVVDDEEEVHSVTRLVLGHITFYGRGIEMINCYSAAEAKKVIEENPDVALMLLDVVMETDNAGLEVVKYVREQLKNHFVRIVLRTGQPGQAPEREVIEKYDINDYKDKTELTSQKLYTLTLTSIRSYRDIMVIEHNKRGLHAIILASEDIFQLRSMRQFARAVLDQMTSLLQLEANALYCKADIGFAASRTPADKKNIQIIIATGEYKDLVGKDLNGGVEPRVSDRVRMVMEKRKNLSIDNEYYAYFETRMGEEHVLYVKFEDNIELAKVDHELIDLFCRNVALGFENVYRYNELIIYQGEVVCRLSEILEAKAEHIGKHIRRVAQVAELLAQNMNVEDSEMELVRIVAPLHDIGELAISQELLIKADEMSEEEIRNIKEHPTLTDAAKNTPQKNNILHSAAIVARQFHEKWDGTGHPRQLRGDEINVLARITRIADSFDTLMGQGAHREAWDEEKILNYFKDERSKTFDPAMVDILIAQKEKFFKIYKD